MEVDVIGSRGNTWLNSIVGAGVSTGVGIAINVATGTQGNWLAWVAVGVLTAAGAALGVGASRRRRAPAGSGDSTSSSSTQVNDGTRNQVAVDRSNVVNVNGNTTYNFGPRWSVVALAGLFALAAITIFVVVYTDRANARPTASAPDSTITSDQSPLATMTDDGAGLQDASAVFPGVVTPQDANTPPGGIKAGNRRIKLTITNRGSRELKITNARAVNVESGPTPAGTLFENIGQSVVPNETMGIDISARPPVMRELSADLNLGDPYFETHSISVLSHSAEVLEITVLASQAQLYRWSFVFDYDDGSGPHTQRVDDQGGLLMIAGYTHSYQRAFESGGTSYGWIPHPAQTYCARVGYRCH